MKKNWDPVPRPSVADSAGIAAAAVFREIGQDGLHLFVMGRVDQKSAVLLLKNQPGLVQFLEMEGQGGGWDGERFGNLTGRHPLLSRLDQKPEDGEATRLGKRRQRGDDII